MKEVNLGNNWYRTYGAKSNSSVRAYEDREMTRIIPYCVNPYMIKTISPFGEVQIMFKGEAYYYELLARIKQAESSTLATA